MCGINGSSKDYEKLDPRVKEKLKEFLRSRQEYLEERISLIKKDLEKLG